MSGGSGEIGEGGGGSDWSLVDLTKVSEPANKGANGAHDEL